MADTVTITKSDTILLAESGARAEHDLLGEDEIPNSAYWGIHTKRAVENFPITGVPVGHFPELVQALAMVKKAAARANRKLGFLARDKADGHRAGVRRDHRRQACWISSSSMRSRAAPAPRPT